MELRGEAALSCPEAQARVVLSDVRRLCSLVPEAGGLRPAGPDRMEGELVLGHPPLARRHAVRLVLERETRILAVRLEGLGRSAHLRLEAELELSPLGTGRTRLVYHMRAELGTLAQVLAGQGLERHVQDFLSEVQRVCALP